MRYRLRTLMIALTLGPPVLAAVYVILKNLGIAGLGLISILAAPVAAYVLVLILADENIRKRTPARITAAILAIVVAIGVVAFIAVFWSDLRSATNLLINT